MDQSGTFCRLNTRFPVDLIEQLVAEPTKMLPSKSASPQKQIAYVFAFTEQGVLDVTRSYSKDTSKLRISDSMENNLGTWIQHFNWLVTPSREEQGPAYVKEARKLKKKRVESDTSMPTNMVSVLISYDQRLDSTTTRSTL
jgi:hypothetical protein